MTDFLDSRGIRGDRQQAKSPPDGNVADALSLPPADTNEVSEPIAPHQAVLSAAILYFGLRHLWQPELKNDRQVVTSIYGWEDSKKSTSLYVLLLAAFDSPTIQVLHALAHQYFQAVSSLRLGTFFDASHINSEEIYRTYRLHDSGKLDGVLELSRMLNTVRVGAENSQPPPELLEALVNAVQGIVSAVLNNPTLQIRGGIPRAAPGGFLDGTKRALQFSAPDVRSLFNMLHLMVGVGFASTRSGGVLSVAPSLSAQEADLPAAEAGDQSSVGPAAYHGLAACMATGLQHLFQVAFLSELSSQGQVPTEVATTLLNMAARFHRVQFRDRVQKFIKINGVFNPGRAVDLTADTTEHALLTLQRGLSFVATRDAITEAVGEVARECASLRQEDGRAAPCSWEDNQFVQVRLQCPSVNGCVTLSALPQGRFGLDDPVEGWKFIHVFLNDQVPQSHHFACPPAGVPRGYSEQCLGVLPPGSPFVLPAGIIDKLYDRPNFTADLLTVKESLDAMLGKLYERFPWFRSAHEHLPREVFVTTHEDAIVLEFHLYDQDCLARLRYLAQLARDEWRVSDAENFLLGMLQAFSKEGNPDDLLKPGGLHVAYAAICKTDGAEIMDEPEGNLADQHVASSLNRIQKEAIRTQLAGYLANSSHLRQLLVALRVDVHLFDSTREVAFANKTVTLPSDMDDRRADDLIDLAIDVIDRFDLGSDRVAECIKDEGAFQVSLLKSLLVQRNFKTEELINFLSLKHQVELDREQGKGSHAVLSFCGKIYTLGQKAFPRNDHPPAIYVFNAIKALGLLCPVLRTLIEERG